MRVKTQAPKYDIEIVTLNKRKADENTAHLINSHTGEAIPQDEPIFILRGKDRHALAALTTYQSMCHGEVHRDAVQVQIDAFERFAIEHPDRIKEPNTDGFVPSQHEPDEQVQSPVEDTEGEPDEEEAV